MMRGFVHQGEAGQPSVKPRRWVDGLLLATLALLASIASLYGAWRLHPIILDPETTDIWFDADCAQLFEGLISRWSADHRAIAHPLFYLVAGLPVRALWWGFGLEPVAAARVVIAAVAGLSMGTLFALLRLIGCRRLDAVVFSLLGAVSACAVFWFTMVETYPFGSLTILLALLVVVLAERRNPGERWFVLASAGTLAFTVTNWMVGIIAAFACFPWRRALQITANALCLVILAWTLQSLAFPRAEFFLGREYSPEFIFHERAGGPAHIGSAFFFHSIVMPAFRLHAPSALARANLLTVQLSPPGSSSALGLVAVALWLILLALGIWAALSLRSNARCRAVVALAVIGQLTLHLIYGFETFLYSLHFGPLLVVLAAFSTLSKARMVALPVAIALVVCAGLNNVRQFHAASLHVRNARLLAAPGVDLFNADLHGAHLRRAELQNAYMRGADLRGADLTGADLRGALLRGADLRGAILHQARLHGVTVHGARLAGAEMSGVDVREATLYDPSLSKAGANLRQVVFRNADLRHKNLWRANLQGASLVGADLRGADLREARLAGADLRQANLRNASLDGAHLEEARLHDADLRGARYNQSTEWPPGFDPQKHGALRLK